MGDVKKTNAVCSHERSGTNFTIELLKLNFGKEFQLRHNLFDRSMPSIYNDIIYVVRDGRDVLVSFFRLLKSFQLFYIDISALFTGLSFSDFLEGRFYDVVMKNTPPWVKNPKTVNHGTLNFIINNMLKDPASYWVKHIRSYMHQGIYIVRYEDLVVNYDYEVLKIKEVLDYEFVNTEGVKPVTTMVGPNPSSGGTGKWKCVFTVDNLERFWKTGGNTLKWFGYTYDGSVENWDQNYIIGGI